MATKGPFLRELALWMLWANSSLPVPVSPTMITLESEAAYCLAMRMVLSMERLPWRMSWNVYRAFSPRVLSFLRIWLSRSWIRVMSERLMTAPEISLLATTGVQLAETVSLVPGDREDPSGLLLPLLHDGGEEGTEVGEGVL